MKVIGISCWYHDSAVAFIQDGLVRSAVQEERFTRKKHDPNFPINALLWTLEEFKLDINNLDYIAYYEDPRLKLSRIKYTHAIKWPKSFYEFKKDIKSQEQKISIERFLRKKQSPSPIRNN